MDFKPEYQRIIDLERKVDFLLKELGLEARANAYVPDNDSASNEMLRLVRSGRKIEAIKLYRERTGVSLAEAKAVIDRLG